jgi:aminopeptidase N
MTIITADSDKGDARLPSIATPHHYDLFYSKIDMQRFTFDGTVSIELIATDESMKHPHSIVLNALDLHFVSATLREKNGSMTAKAEQFRYHLPKQTCEIVFEDSTPSVWKAGTIYILEIIFHGILNDQMHGLYRSSFVGLDGQTHTMATTQFEATDARRAFPCFDEPALKATFCLKLCIAGHLQCISNTPPSSIHTTYVGTIPTKTITFQTTPKMSTYLVALVVGQFDSISKTSNQIQTTVYTVPGKAEQGMFCLDTAVKCLDLYQKLFEVPYPLVKSDLLAIPDFAAGAMENWGCVTYREAKILVKPNSTSESTKRGIARTVCHELAHQWFGNLVTMEFWTQLWLKEGVARFMEFVGIDSIFPEWDAWTEFVQSVYGLAQSLDSMKSSHPVEVEVKHPDEISDIFDAISYAKGASIIRMVSSYIGFQTFLDGMKLYLTRHAYDNAATPDLWRALAEKSGLPIEEIAAPWTCQMGFPILILSEKPDGNIITPRFLASGPDSISEEDKESKWPIPVTARVEGIDDVLGPWVINGPAGDESFLLRDKINEWTTAGKWFKLNVDQCGFYRVAYTSDQWKNLSKVMEPNEPMSASDRLGLISDSFAAGRAGYTSIVDSLNLIKGFGDHEVAGK